MNAIDSTEKPMDEPSADLATVGTLSQQIANLLAPQDSQTRQRAVRAALALLGDETVGGLASRNTNERGASDSGEPLDLGMFFKRDEDLKPSDHAQLCAAYLFSLHGAASFSLGDLRTIASEAGVVLPDRLDMTLKAAVKDKKRLFQLVGKDAYKPTAAAGLAFKERWGVKPGRQPKPTMTNSTAR